MTSHRDDADTVPAPWWARLLLVLTPLAIGALTWWLLG